MPKTISQKICEECGLEAPGKLVFYRRGCNRQHYISAGYGYKEFDFKSQPYVKVNIVPSKQWDENNGFQYPYTEIEKIIKTYDEHGYDFMKFEKERLDFENPENFVQLLELKLKHSSFCIDTFDYPRDKTFVYTFLASTLDVFLHNKPVEQEFMQAIRDYDGWVWG